MITGQSATLPAPAAGLERTTVRYASWHPASGHRLRALVRGAGDSGTAMGDVRAQLLSATAALLLLTACALAAEDDPSWTRAEKLVAQMTLECATRTSAARSVASRRSLNDSRLACLLMPWLRLGKRCSCSRELQRPPVLTQKYRGHTWVAFPVSSDSRSQIST
jgi:hypothetical protein